MTKGYAPKLGPKYIVRKGIGGGPVWALWRDSVGSICIGGPARWLEDMLACLEVGRKKWGLQWRTRRSRGRVRIRAQADHGVRPGGCKCQDAFDSFAEWLGRVDGGARTLQEVRAFRRLVH